MKSDTNSYYNDKTKADFVSIAAAAKKPHNIAENEHFM